MSPIFVALLTAGAVVLAILGVFSIISDLFLRDRSRISQRVDQEFIQQQRERVRKSPLFKNLGQFAEETLANEEINPTYRQRFLAMIDQSGLQLTAAKLLLISAVVSATLAGVAFVLRGSLPLSAVGASVGFLLPILYVNFVRNARLEKLRSQLPDAFDLMARVIRAGQTMSQALQAVADEFPLPISAEFAYCYEQQNLGLSPELTFRDLTRRTGLLELKIFVLAVLIQQQTGGNLAELLGKLAAVVRDRFRIRRQIRTLTAEGRLQGAILLVLPPGLFAVMLLLNPNYAWVLLDTPKLVIATLVSEAFGAFWIRKIVNFDF